MAGVTLLTPWLHNAADLSDYITPIVDAETYRPSGFGEVRTYASGRQRAVGARGNPRSVALNFPFLERTEADWLEAMTGREVMLRDLAGRVLWGQWFEVELPEFGSGYPNSTGSLTFMVITKTAEV